MPDNFLITGYWGEPHVTAENDRGINAGIAGAGRFVLPVGKRFRAEYIGNNTIRMYDGKLLNNGAAAGIPAGEYVDFTISNASQGMKRNDLIVFQYSQNSSSLVESGVFVVLEGTETNGTAIDPVLTQADLLSGKATFDQMAMWRVSVSGATIAAPVQVFDVSSDLGTYAAHIKSKNNPHGVTRSQIGAAAEYGTALQNVNATSDTECNTVLDNMLAGMSDNSHKRFSLYDATLGGSRFYCTIYRYDSNYAVVEAVSYGDGGTRVQKTKGGGSWRSWEYVNPPMVVETEYKTTERLNGKSVYTKVITVSCGKKENSIEHGLSNITPVRCNGQVTIGSTKVSLPFSRAEMSMVVSFDASKVYIDANSEWSGATASVQLWYTKN